MKNSWTKLLLLPLLLISFVCFAKDKDKDKDKPALSAQQKADIFKAQRDLANAVQQITPAQIRVQQLDRELGEVLAKALKDAQVDEKKWKLDYNTLELSEIPEAKPEAQPEEKKPDAK